jgi:hypothetical protein
MRVHASYISSGDPAEFLADPLTVTSSLILADAVNNRGLKLQWPEIKVNDMDWWFFENDRGGMPRSEISSALKKKETSARKFVRYMNRTFWEKRPPGTPGCEFHVMRGRSALVSENTKSINPNLVWRHLLAGFGG